MFQIPLESRTFVLTASSFVLTASSVVLTARSVVLTTSSWVFAGSPTGQQGSDLVTAKKKRQQQMTASGLFSDTGTYATPDSARCIGELQAEYKATAAKAAKLSVPIFGGNIDTDARIVPAIEEVQHAQQQHYIATNTAQSHEHTSATLLLASCVLPD